MKRLYTWWALHGQFSRPVRALRPSRRRAHAAASAARDLEEARRLLELRIRVVAVPHTSGPPALERPPHCICP
ncbi:hypothetical protein, partial [Streptomyces roseoverticillatus]|uniref:hypothetical protein n=1 Tax=Streptomyces roseoverticillatus TaxID=66429 RepID=UPI001F2738B8